MLYIPEKVITSFSYFLNQKNIPVTSRNYYIKWLRYYLDYCHKYRFDYLNPGSLPNFLNKLKEKKQTGIQQKQAHESIRLFFELVNQKPNLKERLGFVNQKNDEVKNDQKPELYSNDSLKVGEIHCNWQKIYTGLNNEIKVRHYSPKTLKSYMIWTRKFQSFTKSKNPEALFPSDVKEFLTL